MPQFLFDREIAAKQAGSVRKKSYKLFMKEIIKFCLVNRTSPACKPGSHKQPLNRVNAGFDPCRRHHDSNLHKFRLFGKVWTVGPLPLVANIDYKFNPSVYCSNELVQSLDHEMYCDFQQSNIESFIIYISQQLNLQNIIT